MTPASQPAEPILSARSGRSQFSWAMAAVGLVAGCFIMVSRSGDPPIVFIALAAVLMQSLLWVAAWWIAAAGYGWCIGKALDRFGAGNASGWHGQRLGPKAEKSTVQDGDGIQVAAESARSTPARSSPSLTVPPLPILGPVELTVLGAGKMTMLLWLAGWAGWFDSTAGWLIAGLGWILAALALLQWSRGQGGKVKLTLPRLPWGAVPASVAIGMLLGATTFAPGGLWDSEAGGYDVLSYHLQLPREWIADGAIAGYHHNVYSYLPSLWETAYAHLGLLQGSMAQASYAAQLLHATMAIAAAAIIGRIVMLYAGSLAGIIAAAIYLCVPWTLITGSMAYNEQAMMAFGAVAFLVTLHPLRCPGFSGLIIGAVCALSTLSKISAPLGIAIPVGILILFDTRGGRSAYLKRCIGLAAGFTVVFAPWLIRNWMWTGNPVFPVAMNLLGSGHWTPGQVARWNEGLRPQGGRFDLIALWQQLFWTEPLKLERMTGYTTTTAPKPSPNFFGYIVPVAAIFAGVVAWLRGRRPLVITLLIVIAAQIALWLAFSHHKGRFLLPLLIPMCVLIGLAIGTASWRRTAIALGVAVIVVCTIVDVSIYASQRIRVMQYLDGLDIMDPAAMTVWRENVWNVVNTLPPDAKVYSEGLAVPYYFARPVSYHTVWDQSPLGEALDQGPEAAKQWLIDQGYTHFIIDWTMLRRWNSPGNYGYDPRVTIPRLEALTNLLTPVHLWQIGEAKNQGLYAIPAQ